MKIQYQHLTFQSKTLIVLDQANKIIAEYQAQGYDLTLRQLYYQFVARDIFPENRRWDWTGSKWKKDPNGTKNAEPNYKWLGKIMTDGRLAGIVDWKSIVDRTRKEKHLTHWDNPAQIIATYAKYYTIDTRADQDHYIETWIEKDALSAIVEQACEPLDVTWFSCRGYVSQSAMWRAANRINAEIDRKYDSTWKTKGDRNAVILHLGDHDPSGIDMTRDIQDRLELFGCPVVVKRIALNMDQVEQYKPPPAPAKAKDSRYADYWDKYGDDCWELDALEPQALVDLITKHVNALTVKSRRKVLIERQDTERDQLQVISDQWDDVVDSFGK